jgi:hypothetical protein
MHSKLDSFDRGSARRKTATHKWEHKHRINAHRHPCLEWGSNPRTQFRVGEDGHALRRGHTERYVRHERSVRYIRYPKRKMSPFVDNVTGHTEFRT